MRARGLGWAALAACLFTAACSRPKTEPQAAVHPETPAGPAVELACLGRVEGRSEPVEVGAAADGVVEAVHVTEGQAVKRGQALAEIGCADLRASLPVAQAVAESARQTKVRLLRGSREEERAGAAERTRQASAEWKRASSDLARAKQLAAREDISAAEFDQAQRNHDVAEARYREALRREELVKAPALPEELAKADAEIRAAETQVEVIRQRIAKCLVTSPMDGNVMRVWLHPGESFSTTSPRPLLQLADLSVLRVRAEVDERDVLKVRTGQKALVFPEGKREQAVAGSVTSLYRSLGRKRVSGDDPADRTDREVLEMLVGLDTRPAGWPLGLRVVVQVWKPESTGAATSAAKPPARNQ